MATIRGAYALTARIKNARLSMIADAAHVPMTENPERFNALAIAWLKGERNIGAPIPERATPSDRDVKCFRRDGMLIEGRYRKIEIDHCKGVVLHKVEAQELILTRATVIAEALVVTSDKVAVTIRSSRFEVSGGRFRGASGMVMAKSEVDFAGVVIEGENAAIEATSNGKILCSLCRLESDVGKRGFHGFEKIGRGEKF